MHQLPHFRTSLATSLLAIWGTGLAFGGCSTVQMVGDKDAYSYLEIDCSPPDASIYVNERYLGEVNRWRGGVVPLKPGEYRIELQREGYHPYLFDLTLRPGRMARLELDLIENVIELNGDRPGP